MRTLILVALTAALLPTGALAYKPGTGGDHTATSNPDKVICRTEEVVGSRLQSEKTCHTAAEWAAYERELRLTTDRIQAQKSYQGG